MNRGIEEMMRTAWLWAQRRAQNARSEGTWLRWPPDGVVSMGSPARSVGKRGAGDEA